MIGALEKAINSSRLGLNCNNDGTVVRVPIPQLTGERRKELVRDARKYGEEAKIAIRKTRRDANDLLKDAEKDKDISEDDLKQGLEKIQEMTNRYVKLSDEILTGKETDILSG
jgi:ribosome recycling factor